MNPGILHSEARLVFNDNAFAPHDFVAEKFNEIWLQNIQETVAFWLGENLVLSLKTSGSTGTPKVISHKKEVLLHSAKATLTFFNLQAKNNALLFLPTQFIGGKMMVFRALIGGLHLHIFEPKSALPKLQNTFDFAALTPMQAAASLPELNQIKTILLGGAPVSESVSAQLQKIDAAVFHGYGMTETASHIALRKVNGTDLSHEYSAMPGVTFSADTRDCLVIDAPEWGVAHLVTNDIVELKTEHAFVWRGRADFVINSGGVKMFPEEIEKQLESQIPVPFFISALPDIVLGEKLILVIETDKNIDIDFSFLPKIQQPKKVFYLTKFMYTTSGKIDRGAIVGRL